MMVGFNETDRKRIIELVEKVFEDGSITNNFNTIEYRRRFLLSKVSIQRTNSKIMQKKKKKN